MSRKKILPRFENEAEEARWVFRNQKWLAEAFESETGCRVTVEEIVVRSRADAKGQRTQVRRAQRGGAAAQRSLLRRAIVANRSDYKSGRSLPLLPPALFLG